MKRITVDILCMIVSSDGAPVDMDGEELDGDGVPIFEWESRRVSVGRFCPNDSSNAKRRTVQYLNVEDATPLKCNCHGKLRLYHVAKHKQAA